MENDTSTKKKGERKEERAVDQEQDAAGSYGGRRGLGEERKGRRVSPGGARERVLEREGLFSGGFQGGLESCKIEEKLAWAGESRKREFGTSQWLVFGREFGWAD